MPSRIYESLPDPRKVRVLSVAHSSAIYGPCESKLNKMVARGELSDVKIGNSRYLLVDELEALIRPRRSA